MESNITIQKSCLNCKFFSQHYCKQGTILFAANCGNCSKKRLQSRIGITTKYCELWEDGAPKKAERKKSIIKNLEIMAKQIHQMPIILQNDEDNK